MLCLSNFAHNRGIVLELQLGYTSIVYHIVNGIYTNFYIYDGIKIRLSLEGCFLAFIYLVLFPTIYDIEVILLSNQYKTFYHLLVMSIGLAGVVVIVIIINRKVEL